MSITIQKKKKKWLWIVGPIAISFIGIVIYGFIIYKSFTETAKEMHKPIDRIISDKREEPVVFEKQHPFSILVLGVDEREGDKGRSDTIIVLTVNPNKKSTKMVSIPRDTYTEIIGKGITDKLNHAYAFGGIEMAMDSVENLLNIPIDYVVQVNMDSFKDIVDAVGGIEVNNGLTFKADKKSFPKGNIKLNGNDALAFVRMRYEDPRGDFGRQDRQKQVIQSVMHKGASVNSLLNYKSIFAAIGDNVKTNMTFEEMTEIQSKYKDALNKVDQLYIQNGEGKTMSGVWYYIMNDAELNDIQSELRKHLVL